MTFLRRYGFSRASRSILLFLLPFLVISLVGVGALVSQGGEANPTGKFFLLVIFDLLIAAALVGLISGLIGGFGRDDEPALGKKCALSHGLLVLVMVAPIALLLLR